MKKYIKVLSTLLLLVISLSVNGQGLKPVKWTFNVEQGDKEATLLITATIDKNWHLYSQNIGEGGPIPTSFKFTPSDKYELTGKVLEPQAETYHDPNFDMDLKVFDNSVLFRQKIKLKTTRPFTINGSLEFMACDDKMCLPPDEVAFEILVNEIDENDD